MHLGCPVRFVEAAGRFICPCHGGVYDFRGEVDGGPPVRPLDRFYTRVRNGQLEIGPRYSRQPRAQALLAARPRRAARRHRPVPLPVAADGPQAPRNLIAMPKLKLPAPPAAQRR